MRELSVGSSGTDVARWKRYLVREGFLGAASNNVFDADASKATTNWQKSRGLAESGRGDAESLAEALKGGLLSPLLDESGRSDETPSAPLPAVNWTFVGAIVVAAITLGGTIYTTYENAKSNLSLEKERLHSSIILQAIGQNNSHGQVLSNLKFLRSLKFVEIDDKLLESLAENPSLIPSGTAVNGTSADFAFATLAATTTPSTSPPPSVAPSSGSPSGPVAERGGTGIVFVQFAGTFARDDVRKMMESLPRQWQVQGTALGGQRTPAAKGYNEIRYGDPADEKAAKLLADDVLATKIVREPLKVAQNNSIRRGTFEIWISN